MKLTSYTNYALRSLQLAALHAPNLVRVEDVANIHKLSKPDVKGVQYQNGRKKGSTNTIEYVLCRDRHTCQMCKKKTGQMDVHHVIWRSNDGSNTPENLITLCEKCHKRAHKKEKFNTEIVLKFEGLKKRFTHPTILNSIPGFNILG